MAAARLPDALWDRVELFLPGSPPRPKRGRPRFSWDLIHFALLDWLARNDWDRVVASRFDPPLLGEPGRPRRRPDRVLGDRGYDAAAIRRGLPGTAHRALADHAPHDAWVWRGPVAVGSPSEGLRG
jgi:hypothetical protein